MQNAMRATMELYGDAMEYPAIHTQVALGTEDLTVKVKLSCCSFFFFFFFSMAVTGWGNCSDHMFFSRWAIAEEACRCVRSTACSPTRTPQLLGPASTGPVLLLWSVFLMCDQRCVTYSDECEPALLQTDPNTSWRCQNLKGTVHSQIIFNKDTYFSSDL